MAPGGRPGLPPLAVLPWLAGHIPGASAIDGQSYKVSDEDAERVWNDPNCDRSRGQDGGVNWPEVRAQLLAVPFPQSMSTVGAVVGRLEKAAELEREAPLCPFGIIAVLFFFVKFLIESPEPQLRSAVAYFSLLDSFAAGMHPHLLNRADWLVTDARVIALRRALLNRQPSAPARRLAAGAPAAVPRIFVYSGKEAPEVQDLSQGASFCGKGQWGMEVHIHEWLLASPHRVEDPADADFFFVPAYSICMFEGGFFPMLEIDELYRKLVRGLPYFGRSGGRDHIFTFGSGMSANVFRSWRKEIPESIFLTPETWLFNDFPGITEPCFDTWKDVAIPGYLHRHEILSLAGQARPLVDREHLAVFLGRTDPSRGPHPTTGGADVRGALRRLHLQGDIFVGQNLSIPDMHGVMGNARFCFVPKGKSAWSLRFYEALFAGCVPVVLSDFWELPFEEFLDVSSFVIKWPMDDVGDELVDFLKSQPDEVLEAYMESGRRARCWYVFPPLLTEAEVEPGGEDDPLRKVCPDLWRGTNAFEGIMKLLAKKTRASWTMGRFFGPPGSHGAG